MTIPNKGSALLAVMWLSAALAAIGFSVATSVRAETERVSESADGLRAGYLAAGAVERGIQWMLWGSDYRRTNGTAFWDYNQPRMNMAFPSGDALIEVIPESAKLNINTANPDDLLRVVLTVSGDATKAREIVEGILDWRSPASAPTPLDQLYFAIDPTFRARHASFEEIEELLLVHGMTPELFYGNYIPDGNGRLYASGGLRECLSVWGSPGPFDVNSASPALMEAMGMPADAVTAVVNRRQIQPFKNMGELSEMGAPAPRMRIGGNVIFTLRSNARLRRPDGTPSDVVRSAAAVVKLLDRKRFPDMPLHVLRWYDDAWSQSGIVPPAIPVGGIPLP